MLEGKWSGFPNLAAYLITQVQKLRLLIVQYAHGRCLIQSQQLRACSAVGLLMPAMAQVSHLV